MLVFVKGGSTENVWFYDMQADGYSLDDKRSRIAENDIPDIISKWNARNPLTDIDRKQKAFFVPRKEIEDNKYDLSINRYKESEYKLIEYEDSKKILDKIEKLEEEIQSGLSKLKQS